MNTIYLMLLVFFGSVSFAQPTVIEEGVGIGKLKIGQTYKEVETILGFKGEVKSYDDYLAEELFNESPDNALECVLGFDYYVKYEHLLTLPVSFVFFKDNVVSQIKISSFPDYYFPIAKDSRTKTGLDFWAKRGEVIKNYGSPELQIAYDGMILDAYFYFQKGITINLRNDDYRSAHIYPKPDQKVIEAFSKAF